MKLNQEKLGEDALGGLIEKFEKLLEDLYEASKSGNIVDHALVAHLLGREKEVLRRLVNQKDSFSSALATLLVSEEQDFILRIIKVLEEKFQNRLVYGFPYTIIALDRFLDKGFLKASRSIFELLSNNLDKSLVPKDEMYIVVTIFERAANSLQINFPSLRETVEMRLKDALMVLTDFALKEKLEKLSYQDYQAIINWIKIQLSESYYSEDQDDIEIFNIKVPPPLFFSPLRLYLVWKFFNKVSRDYKLVPYKYTLDDESRRFFIELLKKEKTKKAIEVAILKGIEDFFLTLIIALSSFISSYLIIDNLLNQILEPSFHSIIIAFISSLVAAVFEKFSEGVKGYKHKIFGKIRSALEERKNYVEMLLSQHSD
ncbi:MAG: hypothetical protein QXR45_08740 [Candidatus Bathyarchaeia archaeon]